MVNIKLLALSITIIAFLCLGESFIKLLENNKPIKIKIFNLCQCLNAKVVHAFGVQVIFVLELLELMQKSIWKEMIVISVNYIIAQQKI
jgi:hypothetical protein